MSYGRFPNYIDALQAENKRLREALERIATKGCALRGVLGPTVKSCLEQDARKNEFFCLQCTARAALRTTPGGAELDPGTVENLRQSIREHHPILHTAAQCPGCKLVMAAMDAIAAPPPTFPNLVKRNRPL